MLARNPDKACWGSLREAPPPRLVKRVTDHFSSRSAITRALVGELLGPAPVGKDIDCSHPVSFPSLAESYGPWRQKDTGEEILQRDPPTKRYGLGVLYPYGAIEEEKDLDDAGADGTGLIAAGSARDHQEVGEEPATDKLHRGLAEGGASLSGGSGDWGSTDLDLSLANTYRPSSMAVSFLAEFPEGAKLVLEASAGRYRAFPVRVADRELLWWLRSSAGLRAEYGADAISAVGSSPVRSADLSGENLGGLDIRFEVYSRPFGNNPHCRLVTAALVNRSEADTPRDQSCLFQAGFRASVLSPLGNSHILSYPGPPLSRLDDEERSLELLYRNEPTFAVGHGCAAGWDRSGVERAKEVRAEAIPFYERPSITPEVVGIDGRPIEVSMAILAGLEETTSELGILDEIVNQYESWIVAKESEAGELTGEFAEAANRHIAQCKSCALRMRRGAQYLRGNSLAARAFRFANLAILMQQAYSRRLPRRARYDPEQKRILFDEDFQTVDLMGPGPGQGKWYAFQIAFLLMAVESVAEPESSNRETVELIWFPTGGGKTEAYLGLAAFAQFMRRLNNPDDNGVHVIMRYTLRLLTTQQFQRASRLVCAMEIIRRGHPDELGIRPFSIGMWVGRRNSPNSREEARRLLTALAKGDPYAQNTFVLDRCPWCGAQMGPLDSGTRLPRLISKVIGYKQKGVTVIFHCPDRMCEFADSLPVYVIDEDIYEERPSMIIGTVDKFALLAWQPEARALFGIDKNGERSCSPPGLIIQDELHLISGPLGSMVGLYEAVIEELCTDHRSDGGVRPKIVCSTATIRRHAEQIRALYAREDVMLFPPPGLDAADSFFARYAVDSEGERLPGTIYVGIHAPGLGSMQTVQVRTFTALLQAPMLLPEEDRDPWWSLLVFFNSLRELGTTLSLLQSDIPDYQKALLYRLDPGIRQRRDFWEVLELTGRASSEDVPKAIAALEVAFPSRKPRPVDVCLASSILEVGVDIERLSLMSVVGQPKTTSQYIQVTGRIGRKWKERPGLVVTIYAASKPRDRSHYEKFRSYHQRLYAQVEPTSVTPFSPPALDRALHAVMVAYVRQAGDEAIAKSPFPFPEVLIEELRRVLLPRVEAVDPSEAANFQRVFDSRARQWKHWQRTKWRASWSDADPGLLRTAGEYAAPENAQVSWPTPQSMRTVDAECLAEIPVPASMGEVDAEQT